MSDIDAHRVVERRVGDDRQHVVGRLGTLRRDELLAVGVHPRAGLLGGHLPDRIGLARARRSRTAARSPRTANAVRTQALPAGCRSSASAARRRRRPGSRTAPPAPPRRAGGAPAPAGRPRPGGSSAASGPELTSRRMCECRGSSIMLSTWPAMARSCSSVPPNGREPPVTDEYVSGSRSTASVSAYVATDQKPSPSGVLLGRLVPVHRRLAPMHGEQVDAGSRRRSCPDR